MFQFSAMPPLALYVHLPWCVRKCPYCDFNSHSLKQGEVLDSQLERAYVDALLKDLELDLPRVWGRPVHSIFFGGGTPSLFSAQAMKQLMSGVRARLPLQVGAEVTLEANPGTVEAARFAGYREAGVNRLSLGIQSFSDVQLTNLGRIHDAQQAHAAIRTAKDVGFTRINLDLMYGLPNQSMSEARDDLKQALAYETGHQSWYQLTLEPNTGFAAAPPALPEHDALCDIQEMGLQQLETVGLQRYEVSAFAADGQACRHNLNYWRFGDYLGIGAGAHAKITEPVIAETGEAGIVRSWRVKHPDDYLRDAGAARAISGTQILSRKEAGFEFMLNALRLRDGFPVAVFAERTGLPITIVEPQLAEAEARGLIERDYQHIRPTEQGFDFLNDLQALFLPE